MILIAESGSTKTHWKLVEKSGVNRTFVTGGFNPNYAPQTILTGQLQSFARELNVSRLKRACFYGSGCSNDHAVQVVSAAFQEVFPGLQVEVQHDLFGAARALFGNGSGIAAILGTGSSSCRFINGKIESAVPSLGYLLADEGSGFHLGKLLLNSFFKNELPQLLAGRFSNQYNLRLQTFLPALYAHQTPGSYVASFVPFLVGHKSEPFVQQLIKTALDDFFEQIILRYDLRENLPLGFVGSIAFLFSDILHQSASEKQLKISKIIQSPVDELVKFHIENDL